MKQNPKTFSDIVEQERRRKEKVGPVVMMGIAIMLGLMVVLSFPAKPKDGYRLTSSVGTELTESMVSGNALRFAVAYPNLPGKWACVEVSGTFTVRLTQDPAKSCVFVSDDQGWMNREYLDYSKKTDYRYTGRHWVVVECGGVEVKTIK